MASVVQLLGIASIITGAFLVSVPLGFVAGGLLFAVVGLAMERNRGAE